MSLFRLPVSNLFRISSFVFRTFLLALPTVAFSAPHDIMKQGLRAYEVERYPEAAHAFQGAAAQAPDAKLDPAIALYNRANALYRMGRHEEASSLYQEALRSTNPDLQHAAHFNRGNALMAMADERVQEQDMPAAMQTLDQALNSYENALTLAPDDVEAKANYELAYRYREYLKDIQPPQPSPQPEPGDSEDEQQEPDPQRDGDAPPPESAPSEDTGDQPEPDELDTSDMTEQEIRMLLDALRDEEQIARERNRQQLGAPQPVLKDW